MSEAPAEARHTGSGGRLKCVFSPFSTVMNQAYVPPVDSLAGVVNSDSQRLAARMAQDVFGGVFRLLATPEAGAEAQLAELGQRCRNWAKAGGGESAQALRLALLVAGLDQWGLAYSQAFGLNAIPPLSALLGSLRTGLEAAAEARFLQYYGQLAAEEACAIDFKIDLRRGIHLALWHAMSASDDDAAAEPLVQALGSQLLVLEQQMPELGWRLVADALASIQAGLLSGDVGEVGQRGTQQLFAALQHALPAERYRLILASSAQAVLAWQQTQRGTA